MISPSNTRALLHDSPVEHGTDAHPIASVWNGFLHEFRNHLTVLMSATSELRAELPPSPAQRVGEAMAEMDRNVQGLTTLVALVDASVRSSEAIVTPLGDVVDRAVRLAGSSAGRRVSITTQVPRAAGARNKGAALESLLAALIVDLARSHEAAGGVDAAPRVRVDGEVGRRGLTLEVACAGARFDARGTQPVPSLQPLHSWRLGLAAELARKLDATLTSHPEASAYVVQLR